MLDHSLQQLKIGVLVLCLVLLAGTAGYMVFEDWGFLDALYMTVISITTTGFMEVHPMSAAGRVLTLFLIVAGVGSIAYIGGRGVQFLLENQLFPWRKGMSMKVAELANHFIVCGYGKMGKYICEELAERKAHFVVIESDAAKIEVAQDLNYLFVKGDATSDDTLLEAGIERARGLVAVLDSDADNVFTTLSAKVLNPKLFVVARAVEEETESKLKKAGASRVVKPYEAAGTKMAELLLRPGVIEFIDVVARDKQVDLNIEEVNLTSSSILANKSLADSSIRKDLNIMIVAVYKQDGNFVYNPKSSTLIEPGDRLIALGERTSLVQLQKICAGEVRDV